MRPLEPLESVKPLKPLEAEPMESLKPCIELVETRTMICDIDGVRRRIIWRRMFTNRIVLHFGKWLRGMLAVPNVGGNGRLYRPYRTDRGL